MPMPMPMPGYGFLIRGPLDRAGAGAALSALLRQRVDVGDEDDGDRDWGAPVNCTVRAVGGELHWHLDVYLDAGVVGAPPEAVAAAWLAERLRTVVAYSALALPPSAYWLVGPGGERTRARIYEEDAGDRSVYRIDAVERPLAALPGLRVAPLPEVIRGYRMPTPVTDRLRVEVPDRRVLGRLGAWEGMVNRLVEGWPPDGWYPAAYYREDLGTRDELAGVAGAQVVSALAEVDRRFREATVDDGGQALAAATGRPVPGDRWWWRRIPRPLPWEGTPGG